MTRYNARFIAIETLCRLEQCTTPLPILHQQISRRHQLRSLDRALSMKITYGVLRQQQYLELLITALSTTPLQKLHPSVRHGLAVGLYQIFFLDRIPHSAAVNETVNAIKTAKTPQRLHKFVNGVLRQAIRQKKTLPQPGAASSDAVPILNHPQWMTSRWAANFGKNEMLAICFVNNRQQELTLRINSQVISRENYLNILDQLDICSRPGNYSPTAVILPDYQGKISSLPGFSEGFFSVQGESAQLASLLLQPFKTNGRYLDGCAGLGGKTGHLLELLHQKKAHVVAVEPEPHRQERFLQSFKKYVKQQKVSLFCGSLQKYAKTGAPKFHGILIDAPCSGTGIIGKHPDIRWRRQFSDIHEYATVQMNLITVAATLLQTNGVLVYATCSLEPEENIDMIHQFLRNNPDFSLTDCTPYLPEVAGNLVLNQCLQPRPTDATDGFFAARLVRNGPGD